MTRDQLFKIWAPATGAWSPWVRPVLFAQAQKAAPLLSSSPRPALELPPTAGEAATPDFDLSWMPEVRHTTIVVDMPSAVGVSMGMALAERGYRPIPLYNAVPGPGGMLHLAPGVIGAPLEISLVDVNPILAALITQSARLAALGLRDDAPPAFLLDSNRRVGRGPLLPNRFDNRSVSLPTDFPSGNLLLSRGIRDAIIVQETGSTPQQDLAHTLRRWQEVGMTLLIKALDVAGEATPCKVARPSGFGSIWHHLLVTAGLRRNPLGGYGAMLPMPSSGG